MDLLNNETNSCSEIKRVASFKNILAFTDSGAYQVKVYDPVDKGGVWSESKWRWTAKSCTFVQPPGIWAVGETISCDRSGNREREANKWAVGYNTIPEAPRSI